MTGQLAVEQIEAENQKSAPLTLVREADQTDNSQQAASGLLATGFLFVNLSLFLAVSAWSVFAPVREDLFLAFGFVFGLLGIGVISVHLVPFLKCIAVAPKERVFSFESLCALNLLLIITVSTIWLFQDPEQYAIRLSAEYLITCGFLIFAISYARSRIWKRMRRSLRFQVFGKDKSVRRMVCETGEVPVETAAETPVSVSAIRPGDIVRFSAGDCIPFDATSIEGPCIVRERELTFRAVQRCKQPGEILFAGSVMVDGDVTVRVETSTEDARLTSFMPEESFPSLYHSSGMRAAFVGATLFAGLFFSLYWHKQEMFFEAIEPVLGSFLALALFSEWYAVRQILPRLQLFTLFEHGLLVKSRRILRGLVSLTHMLVRYGSPLPLQTPRVSQFELLDERLERDGVLNVLFALWSRIDSNRSEAFLAFIREEIEQLQPLAILDFFNYGDQGFCGVVQGADFSVGSESFLIERGVHLVSTEVLSEENEDIWYVALNDSLIARIRFETATGALRAAGSTAGIRVQLSGSEPQPVLDAIGKSLGLELADVHSNESEQEALSRAAAKSDSAVVLPDARMAREVAAPTLTVSFFDRLLFEGNLSDITLVDTSLPEMLSAVGRIKLFDRVSRWIDIGLPVCTVLLAVPAALALLSSEWMLAIVLFCFVSLNIAMHRALPGAVT